MLYGYMRREWGESERSSWRPDGGSDTLPGVSGLYLSMAGWAAESKHPQKSCFMFITLCMSYCLCHPLFVCQWAGIHLCVCVLKKCNYTDIQTFYSCKDIHWHYAFTTSLLLTFTLRTQCFIQTCTMLSFLADLGSNLSLTGSFNSFELVSKI